MENRDGKEERFDMGMFKLSRCASLAVAHLQVVALFLDGAWRRVRSTAEHSCVKAGRKMYAKSNGVTGHQSYADVISVRSTRRIIWTGSKVPFDAQRSISIGFYTCPYHGVDCGEL